ncbi:MAG: efflux RND transporter permease subunit, partial [Calditrichaeota bacterium]|nr:efflux RND transporter permease subunit [Calditrichota bacterium]
MRSIIAYFIRYPVWTNVLMGGTLLFGIMSMLAMKSSFFPEREPRIITVMVPFPGASPEEVEEGVILKIEENLDGLEGIERIISTASENVGNVTVEILEGYELDDVLTEVKNAVDRISSFPVDAERPVVSLQKFRSRSVSMVLHGKADLYNLKFIAENLRDELLIHPMISQVVIDGVPALEFSIEVSEANLRRYGLSFSEIANAVRAFNVNISGGKFETRDEEILIRAYGRNYFARELENIPVRGDQGGTIIFLKDIATIRERWEDSPERTYYNGSPAIVLTVNHTLDEDILDVRQATLEVMEAFNDRNEEVKVTILNDQTVPLRQRLDLLVENGILGLLLVLVVLGFFMNLRVSFWCALGIPISFAGMFLVAKFVGITVNVISLFGMIIVVGILVDDAIVVAEKVYYYYERGMPALKAAVTGTMEVLVPVFTSIATTVVAFMPFFFLLGPMDFIWQMALVVISSLIFSLIEAFLILPAHLAHSKALDANRNIPPLRQKIENIIHIMTNTVYARTLKLALDYKWVTVTVPIVGVFLVIGMLRGGIIGFTQFPYIDRDELIVSVALVNGRQEAVTDSVLQTIEKKVWEVNEEFKAGRPDSLDVVEAVIRQLGTSQIGESGSHTGQVQIQLLNGEVRDMDSFIIANRIREKVGTIPEAQKTSFAPNSFFGKEISVSFLGQDINQLNRARDLLLAEMENMPNVKDITDSNQEGRRELNIRLKPRAYALGLTLQDVAGQVRQGFFGQEVQRIQRGRDEIRVWVRYREDDRSALGFLNQMRIRTPDG